MGFLHVDSKTAGLVKRICAFITLADNGDFYAFIAHELKLEYPNRPSNSAFGHIGKRPHNKSFSQQLRELEP